MKRTLCVAWVVVSIVLASMIGCSHFETKEIKRDFEFHGGIRSSGDDYVISESYVLVNLKEYDTVDLLARVYEEFCKMNGEPDELILYLYDSEEALKSNSYFVSKHYVNVEEKDMLIK